MLERSKCLDNNSAFIRGIAGQNFAYVTVKFVPCFQESDPGVECAPIRDLIRAKFPIEGYAITRKVMLSDKEDSLKNRMVGFV